MEGRVEGGREAGARWKGSCERVEPEGGTEVKKGRGQTGEMGERKIEWRRKVEECLNERGRDWCMDKVERMRGMAYINGAVKLMVTRECVREGRYCGEV